MSSPEQHDRIERYLHGNMRPGELDEFTKAVKADPRLASEVKLHEEITETLAGERIHRFRQTVREVDAKWKPARRRRLQVFRQPLGVGIAAGLLLLIGLFIWLALPQPTPAELAADNFEQLPLQALMSSNTEETVEIRKAAHQAYIAEDYQRAADYFGRLAQLLPEDLEDQLYLGVSQLGADAAEAAIATLKPLATGQDPAVRSEATWYLALAHLKREEVAAARPYLQTLVREEGYQWERARKLLQQLD